ncbi:hypothetical protein [Macrococcus capreoli]|uniref:hypothetical protein n=1 Tax=Macrococcus capreoli TaxID=2982690 RepID=UPI003EE6D241
MNKQLASILNDDLLVGLECLMMKLKALNHHEHNHLISIEHSLETKWCQQNRLAYEYMKEVNQDLYISTTLIRDIEKDIERLYEEICKEKADNVRPDQETTLPATND